jgi:hypothetical protein
VRARQVGGAKEFLPDGQDGRDGETVACSARGLSLLLPDHSEHNSSDGVLLPSRRGKTVIEGQHASTQRSNSVLKKMCPSPAQTVRRLFAKEAATEPPMECSAENGSRRYSALA